MSAYLLLGRTGDLISILPFLKAEADTGNKPTLVVSNQHTDLFEGVSCVNVVPFDGGIHLLPQAMDFARAQFPGVKSLQVVGQTDVVRELTYRPAGKSHATCTSFIKEMWSLAGKMPLWDDVLPLVFDKRSPERESALLKACKIEGTPGRKKPFILVACKGQSSPFPYSELLLELVRLKFGKEFNVIELPRSERIYDLLALYERAHCLVAVDSAPLHLARAVPSLPVIALTNDRPLLWNGSSWQPQWTWCCRYHDFPERAVEMLRAIESCREECSFPQIYVWNAYRQSDKLNIFRKGDLPVLPGMCGRDSANVLKDQKRVPYLKDCLRMGLQRADGDGQYVCLVRPDTHFMAGPPLMECFAYRMTRNGEGDTFSPIVDAFCAEKQWWKSHLSEIPDFLFGSDYQWSDALRVMFQKYGAKDVTGVCYREAKHA